MTTAKKRISPMRVKAIFLCTLFPAFAVPAAAQDSGVIYAGGGVGEGRNVYAGAVIALPGAELGNGLAVRIGGNGGHYNYQGDTGEVGADYVGGEVALVWQTSGDWGWANFSAGPRVTYTDLDPNDPANDRQGTRIDAAIGTDGALGHHWRLSWFGSYAVRDEAYITEARFGPLIDEASQIRLGVEAGFQGDPSYERGTLGAFASTKFSEGWEGRLSGGISEQAGRNAKPYVAVAFSRLF